MQEKTVNSPEETAKKQDSAEIQKADVNWNGYTPPPTPRKNYNPGVIPLNAPEHITERYPWMWGMAENI